MAEFTDNDERLVKYLMDAGLPKNIARTIVYLKSSDEVTSVEVERTARLRQPEVSIAMQWLENKGWITKREIKKEGKGRPVYKYKLAKPFSEIVKELEADLNKKIEEITKIINGLKEFS